MARAHWPLKHGSPVIEVVLTLKLAGTKSVRTLLADTGAGNANSVFEMILDEDDCLLCAGQPSRMVSLGGAYVGTFPLYLVRVEVPQLGFGRRIRAIGVPKPPPGLDGIACFRFLNRFTYGNFGNTAEFGLEI